MMHERLEWILLIERSTYIEHPVRLTVLPSPNATIQIQIPQVQSKRYNNRTLIILYGLKRS
jgi:hypothetical protein